MIVTPPAAVTSLSELGNVPSSYEHEWRVAEPKESIVLPVAIFKWYHVHRQGVPVAAQLDADARALISREAVSDDWDLSYGLNFALLHESTTHAFLITGVWRNHQELWERVYSKDLATSEPFIAVASHNTDTPCACVWELGVICHERMAWHRYLFTERAEADTNAWLADTYTGRV